MHLFFFYFFFILLGFKFQLESGRVGGVGTNGNLAPNTFSTVMTTENRENGIKFGVFRAKKSNVDSVERKIKNEKRGRKGRDKLKFDAEKYYFSRRRVKGPRTTKPH